MRSSHGKGEYAPHGALLFRRRAMGSNDLLPYALPTSRKPPSSGPPLHRLHLRRYVRRPQRRRLRRRTHRVVTELSPRRSGRLRRRFRGLRVRVRLRGSGRLGGGGPGRRRGFGPLRRAGPRLRGRGRGQPATRRRPRTPGSPGSAPGRTPPGSPDGSAEPLGSGDSAASRSECASARPPPVRPLPVPATVPPSGSAPPPFESDDRDGDGFPPSSPTLMQPVDAATVTAMTDAHRTGAENWRTGGTSGGRRGGGAVRKKWGRCAQLP